PTSQLLHTFPTRRSSDLTSKRDRRSSLVSDRFVVTGGAKSQSRSSADDVWGLLRLCRVRGRNRPVLGAFQGDGVPATNRRAPARDRKSTRLNSSHLVISY